MQNNSSPSISLSPSCTYSHSQLPRRNKIDHVADKLIRMLAVVKMSRIVDDKHPRTCILFSHHIEERQADGKNRRRIVLAPVKQGRSLQPSFFDPSAHLRGAPSNDLFIPLRSFAAHRGVGL